MNLLLIVTVMYSQFWLGWLKRCTSIAEDLGSNLVEVLECLFLLFPNCLNCIHNRDDHS